MSVYQAMIPSILFISVLLGIFNGPTSTNTTVIRTAPRETFGIRTTSTVSMFSNVTLSLNKSSLILHRENATKYDKRTDTIFTKLLRFKRGPGNKANIDNNKDSAINGRNGIVARVTTMLEQETTTSVLINLSKDPHRGSHSAVTSIIKPNNAQIPSEESSLENSPENLVVVATRSQNALVSSTRTENTTVSSNITKGTTISPTITEGTTVLLTLTEDTTMSSTVTDIIIPSTISEDTTTPSTITEDTTTPSTITEDSTTPTTITEDTTTPSTITEDTTTPSTITEHSTTPSTITEHSTTPSTITEDTTTPSTITEDTTTPSTITEDTTTPSTITEDTTKPSTITEDSITPSTITEDTTTPSTITEHSTTPSTITEHSTTPSTITEHSITPSTITEDSTTPSTITEHSTTPSTITEYSTTPSTITEDSTTPSTITEDSTTPSTITEDSTTPSTITEHSTTPSTITEDSTTPSTITEYSTTPSTITEDSSTPSTITEDTTTPSTITEDSTTPSTITEHSTTPSTITEDSTTPSTITEDSSTPSTITEDTTMSFTITGGTSTSPTTAENTTMPSSTSEETKKENTSEEVTIETSTVGVITETSTVEVTNTTVVNNSTTTPQETTLTGKTTLVPSTDIVTNCTHAPTTEPPAPDKDVSVEVVAGILGVLLLGGLVATGAVMYRQGKLPWKARNSHGSVRPHPIHLSRFENQCSQLLETPARLGSEFQLLQTLSADLVDTNTFVAAQLPDNKKKNRYINILPYDLTRVKLEVTNDDPSDYINASYIKGYSNTVEYIASQGPKEETLDDFWRMMHQNNVRVIAMVTNFEEGGKKKCEPYFPKLRDQMLVGDSIIRCTTELHFPMYTQRTIVLHKDDKKRSITHLHFNEWPDFGCPEGTDSMLQFCGTLRHHITHNSPGLALVHCSAGVGRTGTLIALDTLLQHIQENKKVDIFGTVYKLRKQRTNMVQTEGQYAYIYKCIKDALQDSTLLKQENSPTNSLEPIYENVATKLTTFLYEKLPETKGKINSSESECEL